MLLRIFHLLIKFRARKFAFSVDVSMAYNAVKLEPKFYTYQWYLWKPYLNNNNSTTVICIKTLIYGVRPLGGMTQADFTKLADHALISTHLYSAMGQRFWSITHMLTTLWHPSMTY